MATDPYAEFAPAAADPYAEFQTATPAPTPDETVGRVAGLTGRALASGTAAIPDTVTTLANPLASVIRSAVNPSNDSGKPYAPQLSDFIHPDKWQDAVNFLADKAGLAKPETQGERIYSKAVEAIPSGVLAPEAPIAGAASGMLGGAASQTVKENGGGIVAQTLAGLAAGSIPAMASGAAQGARALIRNQADTAARIADAAESGSPLTAGQASGSQLLQRIEGASSKVWGGGPIKQTADAQTANLGGSVDRIIENLSQGADVSPTTAGAAINAGVNAAKQSMRTAEKAAYDKVDTLVPPQSPIDVSGTIAKLDSLASPTSGAAQTTAALVSPKIAAMRDNLNADIAANGGNPQIPYEAASALKTALGNSIDWGFAPSDPVTNGALKLVHGTLKGDIDTSASAISPEANQAVTDARTLYTANQARRDALNPIIDKAGGPEAVYQAATNGTKQGATKIGGVMSALAPDQQNLVRATVIDRLGRALPSAQNAAGDAFNASTFLTNWNKLAPEAKDALFGTSGAPKSLRAGLDSLTNTLSTVRNSTVFKNPSGTAEAAGHGYGLLALMGEGGVALTGHPHALAATAGAIAGNAVLSRALTNPRVVSWLAQSTKLPTSALPNAINQLSNMGQNDPDARDLSAYLQARQAGN